MKAETALRPKTIEASEPAPRHVARRRLSFDLLASVLLLPDGTKIDSVRVDPQYPDQLELRIEHPSLHPVPHCHAIPVINPTYSQSVEYHPKFESWGQ